MDLNTRKEALQKHLDSLVENSIKKSSGWTEDEISDLSVHLPERVVESLHKQDSNFKYCAVCTVTKKSQSSLHINSACMWNASRDGFLSTQAENPIFFCIVNVFAIGL